MFSTLIPKRKRTRLRLSPPSANMSERKFLSAQDPMQTLLEELNPEQRRAAETTEGPVLILAGAGTGKTRAITFRMANLIANGTPAESILAVTFTNKAAEEMRNRVGALLLRAGVPPAQPWLSTFHSLCARLLRREAPAAGLPKDFAIYDDRRSTRRHQARHGQARRRRRRAHSPQRP